MISKVTYSLKISKSGGWVNQEYIRLAELEKLAFLTSPSTNSKEKTLLGQVMTSEKNFFLSSTLFN